MSRLGETIKTARIAAKMSEKALAKKCGFSEAFIKEIESGRRIVSDDQAQRVLKVLGVKNPVSTELEVASEPEVKLRPRPKPYILPAAKPEEPQKAEAVEEANDAWLNALGGVVRRVPVMDEEGLVIDHVLEPIIGGRIEGGHPEKVLYYRLPDDSLRGYRIHAGDLLLIVPESAVIDEAVMLLQYKNRRIVRKVMKQDGNRVLLESYDREYANERVERRDLVVVGKAVKLVRRL